MEIKQTSMTFRFALSVLESEFNSVYRGVKTVDEMCTTLVDRISWEGEDGGKLYHQFETKSGPNMIVGEDSVIALAESYYNR